MSLIKKFFSGRSPKLPPPKGVCPNCWGRQEYQNQVYEAIRKTETDVTKLKDKKGWVRAYAMENLPKLWLKENGGTASCPTCYVEYNLVKEK